MEYRVLGKVRFLVPGALLYLLLVFVCWATTWYSLPIPQKWEDDLAGLTMAIVFAFPYSASGLRQRMNLPYFERSTTIWLNV
jgi:hypothetical protein